jgi:hypothetical protein
MTIFFVIWTSYACVNGAIARSSAPQQGEDLKDANQSSAIVDIRQHGAVGNGEVDDTLSMEKAFAAACAAAKRFVYVPQGTYIFNPSVSKLEICSNETVSGPGTIRVKAETGNYGYIFGPQPVTKPVNNFMMQEITVDQNAYKNSSAAVSGVAGRAQLVVAIYAGSNLAFRHFSINASCVNAISVNGPAVQDVTVDQCHFIFQKYSVVRSFDNSAIYINS